MKKTITLNDFKQEFNSIRPNNFTEEGLEILFDHLEQYESGCGEQIELDVIALCCDYEESDVNDIIASYFNVYHSDAAILEEKLVGVELFLEENTTLCGMTSDNNFVFAKF